MRGVKTWRKKGPSLFTCSSGGSGEWGDHVVFERVREGEGHGPSIMWCCSSFYAKYHKNYAK